MNSETIGYIVLIILVGGFLALSQIYSRKKMKEKGEFLSKKLDEFGGKISLVTEALQALKTQSSAKQYKPELLEARQFFVNKNTAYWVMATYNFVKTPALVLYLLIDANKHFPSWILGSTYDDGMVDLEPKKYSAEPTIKKYKDAELKDLSAILICAEEMEPKIMGALRNISSQELQSLMESVLSVECFNQYALVSFYFNDPNNLTDETFTQMQRLAEITTTQILPSL